MRRKKCSQLNFKRSLVTNLLNSFIKSIEKHSRTQADKRCALVTDSNRVAILHLLAFVQAFNHLSKFGI